MDVTGTAGGVVCVSVLPADPELALEPWPSNIATDAMGAAAITALAPTTVQI